MAKLNVAIIPGNGAGGDIRSCNWYGWLQDELQPGIECRLRDMPDPYYAKSSVWLPFMQKSLRCDESTVVVGHSSGAVAALRYAETHRVRGIILVSAYLSDLGDSVEAASGYFDGEWNWQAISSNSSFIVQFASKDDHLVPFSEQLKVTAELRQHGEVDLQEFEDRNHFMQSAFPELAHIIRARTQT
ncbi:serine hydrolase RBBP9-like [Sycon ciliatum]|uniref:serine hydrolase RBBP9-like n=1 Tax=Sycon ciliatum TaxID=27933 RepID=UPI0031F6AC58|eukprot:scpid70877/ scgid8088/ Putative hydrolase RBBP9; B5T-overexpressed gene protein; Retinoblastoma-binding protein 10; Retinoblastoma-binding protein 9